MKLAAALLLTGMAAFAADEIPAWVREAAAAPIPQYGPTVQTVVILQEEHLRVEPDGKRVMEERGALKVLARGPLPSAYRFYNSKSGRIRDFRGWVVPPGGKAVVMGKNQVVDSSPPGISLYDEYRLRRMEAAGMEPGSVFAWEIVEEEKTLFTQYTYSFQGMEPVLASRFLLTLPAGWESRELIFNREAVKPVHEGSTARWEMKNLPPIEREPSAPRFHALAPRLAVSYYPSGSQAAGLRPLAKWRDVSAWLSELQDAQSAVTPAVQTKAAELTRGAAGDLDKIRAIGRFAQQVNYVSVDFNLTRGGGYVPRPAETVLRNQAGDCKDKANLMRSLLRAAGIESYLVAIYSGDRTFVRPEWPSPQQFNHAIIAIRVPENADVQSAVETPGLGRLLFFDPTDEMTPVGDLPSEEQGSFALVVAGDRGDLVRVPQAAPGVNRVETAVDGSLDAEGKVEARLVREYFGQTARGMRGVKRLAGDDDVKKTFEQMLHGRLGGVTVRSVEAVDREAESRFSAVVAFSAGAVGQSMQGRLLLVKQGMLASGSGYTFGARERTLPVRLRAQLRKDVVRLTVPEGFVVDEMPDAAKIESPYGRFEASWKAADGKVVLEQTIEIRDVVAPASDYAKVREFFDAVGAAGESAAVVLMKK